MSIKAIEGTRLIIKCRNKSGYRIIPPHRWYLDRNTPVGDDADIYEIFRYGGKKYIPWHRVIEFSPNEPINNNEAESD